MFTIVNQSSKQIGIEIYYYKNHEIKCECMFVKPVSEKIQIEISDVYQLIFFYEGRFHQIAQELLDKKIKSIEFPFFTARFEFTDTIQLTLVNSEV